MADEVMTMPEAAAYLKIHLATLKRWIQQRVIPVAKSGRRVLVRKQGIDEVVRQHEQRRRPRTTAGAKIARDNGEDA